MSSRLNLDILYNDNNESYIINAHNDQETVTLYTLNQLQVQNLKQGK